MKNKWKENQIRQVVDTISDVHFLEASDFRMRKCTYETQEKGVWVQTFSYILLAACIVLVVGAAALKIQKQRIEKESQSEDTAESQSEMTADYKESSRWYVYHNGDGDKTYTYIKFPINKEGYYAVCTGKDGNCSYNMVKITCTTNEMAEICISELDKPVYMNPLPPYRDYVEFKVEISYGNGNEAGNSGIIGLKENNIIQNTR